MVNLSLLALLRIISGCDEQQNKSPEVFLVGNLVYLDTLCWKETLNDELVVQNSLMVFRSRGFGQKRPRDVFRGIYFPKILSRGLINKLNMNSAELVQVAFRRQNIVNNEVGSELLALDPC